MGEKTCQGRGYFHTFMYIEQSPAELSE